MLSVPMASGVFVLWRGQAGRYSSSGYTFPRQGSQLNASLLGILQACLQLSAIATISYPCRSRGRESNPHTLNSFPRRCPHQSTKSPCKITRINRLVCLVTVLLGCYLNISIFRRTIMVLKLNRSGKQIVGAVFLLVTRLFQSVLWQPS